MDHCSRCRMTRFFEIVARVVLVALASVQVASAQTSPITTMIDRHCVECHSGTHPEANLDLTSISADIRHPEANPLWVLVYDRVTSGEMPPASAAQPDVELKGQFLQSLETSLREADQTQRQVVLRRLNRAEYENTVRDLFGIHVDVQSILPKDSPEQGFDTIGSHLSVSAELMVAYLEAADLVLDQLFGAPRKPRRIRQTVNMKDLPSNTTADRILDDGVVLFSGAKELPLYGINVVDPGVYRLRIQAKAVQSERPVVMQLNTGVTGRIPATAAGFFAVPPNELTTIEFKARTIETYDTFSFKLIEGFPWWSVKGDYAGAGLFLGNVDIEGPIEEWPPASRVRLLEGVDPSKGVLEDVRTIMMRIVPRAFRQATTAADVEPFVQLAAQAMKDGLPFEKALRRALKGVLCAPEFLFLEEPIQQKTNESGLETISDFALAARLSYFLWRSLPDRELLELAEHSTLHRADVLRAQVERMLADPKSRRFVESFTDQWLRLTDIDFTVPDDSLYPGYNELLRQSMLDETHAFFREVLDRNHGVQCFIDSDFVMINEPLAKFYGIRDVEGLEIRRVQLPKNHVRGGVLTQASVLKVSADGTRTSPVLRGAWILKNLYGTPSRPPPATVAAVEPDVRGATTIRERLAKHRDHESCNSCHRKIDAPGFALECFDVLGAERQWYRTRGSGEEVAIPRHPQAPNVLVQYRKGPEVDTSGLTADGQPFADIRQYKRLLLQDETAMASTLTRLLLTYSVGRSMGFSDRTAIQKIVANVQSQEYGLRSIIHEVVGSDTFRAP